MHGVMLLRVISLLTLILLLAAHGNAFRTPSETNGYGEVTDDSNMEHHMIRERVKRRSRNCSIDPSIPDPSLFGLEKMRYWAEEVMTRSLHRIKVTLGGKPSADKGDKVEVKAGPWPRGIIPYKFNSTLTRNQKKGVKNVLRTIKAFTCLKFVAYMNKKRQTANERFCLRHSRYVVFSEITTRVNKVQYRKKRPVNPDLELSHSRYYQIKALSQANECYGCKKCKRLKINCENHGYLTLVNGRCACVCPSGLDPSTGCRSVFTSAMTEKEFYPSGSYALPLVNSLADCPNKEFDKRRIQLYIDPNSRYMAKSNQTLELFYCVHTRGGEPRIKWPLGSYCIFRTSQRCPRAGFRRFRTVYKYDASNTEAKPLFFCCKRTGFAVDEMVLPFKFSFTLIQNTRGRCRPVKGMYHERKQIPYQVEIKTEVEGKNNSLYTLKHRKKTVNLCSYRPAFTDCGGVFDLNRRSSSYSVHYSNDRDIVQCTWLFNATETEYSRLVLDIENVAIEHVSDMRKCTQYSRHVNELEVRYQQVGEPGISVCGTSFPKSIMSQNSTLLLRLITVGRQWANFTATVRAIEPEDMCYSMKDNGRTYVGDVNFTRDFEPCLPWSEMTHCPVHMFKLGIFHTVLDGNKCRNPNEEIKVRPWCYTEKKDCKWNYCDVCLNGRAFDTRLDCYKTDSVVDCPIYGCAKTCSHVLPKKETNRRIGRITCGRPTDTFVGTEPIADSLPPNIFYVGEAIMYGCKSQSTLRHARFCLTNGQWSPMGSICFDDTAYCTDMWFRCPELIKKHPSFCRIFREMTSFMCRFTCGECEKKTKPQCVVKRGGRLAVLRKKQGLAVGDRVCRGTSVYYRCRLTRSARYLPDSGNEVRACLASGKWSGSQLTCRNVCPRLWKYNPENRMCYKKFNIRLNHFKASRKCSTFKKAQLISLKSRDEWRFIQDFKDGDQIWIGLVRLLKVTNDDPGWFWSPDKSRPRFANWHSGHPFPKSTDKRCVVMGSRGWWRSVQCENNTYRFVCQTPVRRK
ncbi:hypothetical protein RRG08_041517 [Elysia crispata]|uniref:Uncharacterized protein n=1 Tax=Elysia crispata TaxID=231223 RepID=A0AAE0ZLQ8_9GAST|nr:hypothetical protein RRG08_041517 [Elysia crispata]